MKRNKSSSPAAIFDPRLPHPKCINQQFWCWGQDVKHPEGNLLIRYGFAREERPLGRTCASLYALRLCSQARIVLRGFGLFMGDDRLGGIFVKRDDNRPWLTPRADLEHLPWELKDLPELDQPKTLIEHAACNELTHALCRWICAYEQWVVATCGIAYRRTVVENWRSTAKSRWLTYETMVTAWQVRASDTSEKVNAA